MTHRLLLATLFAAAAMLPAMAQEFPTRPIRVIVPVPPGGVIDNGMRAVSDVLGERLGQQIVIENRPGANGVVGAQVVAQSAPDGYTLLACVDGTAAVSLNPAISPQAPLQTLRDFTPVTKLGDFYLVLVANPKVPAKNLSEFLAMARKSGESYGFGTSGIGSTPHLSGELLAQRTGVKLLHVPYKGGGQAITDVLGGQIPLVFTTVPSAQQHVKQGKLVALGVASSKRSAVLPDTPTFIESGLPGFDVSGWVGIFAPAGTPQGIVERLQKAFADAEADPKAKERFDSLGLQPVANPPAEFAQQVRADQARWAEVVKKGNIRIE
jgi:tripartite-type tricarboxylate transporter receptor subunit TctC